MQDLFCFKKDCNWSENKVLERRAQLAELKKKGQLKGQIDELPLFSFYKSKSKQLKNQKNKCIEPSETLCQQHYFQKKVEGEKCKQCLEEHDYEEQQPKMVKIYADKKRKLSNNRSDRLLDYLSAYVEYELMDSSQYKMLDKMINDQQTKQIDRRVATAIRPKQDLFTLEQIYKIENLPNVQVVKGIDDSRKDHNTAQIIQTVSGFDKKISQDKGINLLLKRYHINQ